MERNFQEPSDSHQVCEATSGATNNPEPPSMQLAPSPLVIKVIHTYEANKHTYTLWSIGQGAKIKIRLVIPPTRGKDGHYFSIFPSSPPTTLLFLNLFFLFPMSDFPL